MLGETQKMSYRKTSDFRKSGWCVRLERKYVVSAVMMRSVSRKDTYIPSTALIIAFFVVDKCEEIKPEVHLP
jgi:hypothetical protein